MSTVPDPTCRRLVPEWRRRLEEANLFDAASGQGRRGVGGGVDCDREWISRWQLRRRACPTLDPSIWNPLGDSAVFGASLGTAATCRRVRVPVLLVPASRRAQRLQTVDATLAVQRVCRSAASRVSHGDAFQSVDSGWRRCTSTVWLTTGPGCRLLKGETGTLENSDRGPQLSDLAYNVTRKRPRQAEGTARSRPSLGRPRQPAC
jgi:hypothetical protein